MRFRYIFMFLFFCFALATSSADDSSRTTIGMASRAAPWSCRFQPTRHRFFVVSRNNGAHFSLSDRILGANVTALNTSAERHTLRAMGREFPTLAHAR
jgi:hypothetical protein